VEIVTWEKKPPLPLLKKGGETERYKLELFWDITKYSESPVEKRLASWLR